MPVFPDVGSTSTLSGRTRPALSMSSIIATPMRSFTLAAGLKNSSLARIFALMSCICGRRRSRTIGVSPTASVIDAKMRPRPGRWLDFARDGARGVAAGDIGLFSDKTGHRAAAAQDQERAFTKRKPEYGGQQKIA